MTPDLFEILTKLQDDRIQSPECLIDDDGDFCFDWQVAPHAVLAIAVSPTGYVTWSAIIDKWSGYGHCQLPEWDNKIEVAFRKLAERLQP